MTHIETNLYRYGSNSIVKLLKMKYEKNAGTFSHHFQSTFYGRYESLYHKRDRKPTIKGTLQCIGKLFCCLSWNPGHENSAACPWNACLWNPGHMT